MSSIREFILDAQRNFWEVHPEYKSIEPFSTLWKTSKKDKVKLQNTSDIMWYVTYMYHPVSDFFPMEFNKKSEIVAKSIFGKEWNKELNDNKKSIETLIKGWKAIETPLAKALRVTHEKFEQKSNWLEELPYTSDTFDIIDKAINNMKGNQETIEKLEAKYLSTMDTETMGGGEASLTDQGKV